MFILQKTRVISAVAVALLAASFGSQAAGVATTAQITVTATVDNNTCEWKTTGDQTVALGNHKLTEVLAGTEISKPFTLELTNCPAGISVKAKVTGTESGGVFSNTAASTPATNVGVTIWDAEASPVKVTNGNESTAVTTGGSGTHDASLKFIAKLEKTATGTPTAGEVSVPITMTIVYP